MTHIEAHNLSVRYPVLNSHARSLKNRVLACTTGGRISKGVAGIVKIEAVSDLSFRFERGERIALIGHNGNGKTTLLRVLGGITTCPMAGSTSGAKSWPFSTPPSAWTRTRPGRRTSCCGRSFSASHGRTSSRGPTGSRSSPDSAASSPCRCEPIWPAWRHGSPLRSPPAVEADILLVEEGIGAGDAAFADKAIERLESFIERTPIVEFVSHDEDTTRRFCTRGLVLQQGRLLFDGDIDTYYAHYATITGAAVG